MVRSTSTTKVSRLSVSQSESTNSSRPTRSSSVTRPSVSTSQYSTYSSNRSSSILNTSSASVSSYTRPSSPITRSSSVARPSTPSARATASRSSTPSRIRPVSTSSSIEKPRPSQNSRPSTPSSRPQIAANISSTTARSNSRPSTPTRRNSAPSLSPSAGTPISSGRVLSNGRNGAPASRPSSPSPRLRPPQQPIFPPDFPLETPPNLRTTLPDRPLSAGRSRPGAAVTVKGNSDISGPVSATRRQPSPVTTRGRVATAESTGRGRVHANVTDALEPRRSPNLPELGMRKPVKSVMSLGESTGFGRTISKKSLDMAIRHMDIRNGAGGSRALSGTTLFPQSIRSSASKNQSARTLSAPPSVNGNGNQHCMNDIVFLENGSRMRTPAVGGEVGNGRYSAKLTEVDIYESSRYDAMLLKEDLKNTNWLHSFDDKSDQGLIFDNGSGNALLMDDTGKYKKFHFLPELHRDSRKEKRTHLVASYYEVHVFPTRASPAFLKFVASSGQIWKSKRSASLRPPPHAFEIRHFGNSDAALRVDRFVAEQTSSPTALGWFRLLSG
ncbi:hypothetical protein NL676_001246 [Syzygium grande]|nr:hypothetical protein NL676_001246 [Syzygium grande]